MPSRGGSSPQSPSTKLKAQRIWAAWNLPVYLERNANVTEGGPEDSRVRQPLATLFVIRQDRPNGGERMEEAT